MRIDEPTPETLHDALRRLHAQLSAALGRQRAAGRLVDGDALRGVAIEPGEAEGLLDELGEALGHPPQAGGAVDTPPRRDAETPLARAARAFQLGAAEMDALVLCIAVERDARFARLVAFLNDHIARDRPTPGLVLSLGHAGLDAVTLTARPAFRWQLLRLDGDGTLARQAMRVAPEMLARLCSHEPLTDAPPEGPDLDDLVVAPEVHETLVHWAGVLSPATPLVAAGDAGAGRATLLRAGARRAGRHTVTTDWSPTAPDGLAAAAREALWHDAVLLVRVGGDGPDTAFAPLWSVLSAWPLPVALTVAPAALEALCAASPHPPLLLQVDRPTIARRERLWERSLQAEAARGRSVAIGPDGVADLAARFDFQPAQIARAIRRASGPLDTASLAAACRAVGTANMGAGAQRLATPYTRADLVAPAELMAELDLACAWVRNRRRVFEQWGFGRRIALGRGMTALFAGPPGTGKTMAAQVLAHDLGLDLFRVDLSRVMDKYIGETEKNLSRLFDEAAAGGVVLFFDEADALFGKRSEVKDAHDRYANLEIGYLLQRMEAHEGVSVLATNRIGDLDDAFTRRFHFILDFPLPGPKDRLRIWEGLLATGAEREHDLALDSLAAEHELSGGEIRNSVLSAAFLAAAEGVPIAARHLRRGLRREMQKTGRVLDAAQWQALDR